MVGARLFCSASVWNVKKAIDLILAGMLVVGLAPLLLIIAVFGKATSPGAILYRSQRVGRDNRLFTMYKFRTMRKDAPQVATHLMVKPDDYLTSVGSFLRRTSLDELPQFFNVLRGEMSLVGPRPALFNQHDLIEERTRRGVHRLLPGITGWAQVNGRDEVPLPTKVAYDEEYLHHHNLVMDLRILARTALQACRGAGVSH